MAATLSLSLQGSNYDNLSSSAKKSVDKPDLFGDTWKLSSSRSYKKLTVENFDRETVEITKAKFEKLNFRYDTDQGGSALIDNSVLNKARFSAGSSASEELLVFGSGSKVNGTKANLGKGNDSLEFKQGSKSKGGRYELGEGSDTAVFGVGSRVRSGNKVDLGKDSNVDTVDIANASSVKGLVIENYGKEDVLRIGGNAISNEQILAQKGKVDGITIKLQDA